ncbi:SpoIIE family protein phosphatase [Actinoplanes sp. NPDC051475]|uniref:SpoIIE family protein phosphatase n=1 Tax=Actinoplanes sp. NPDC051475 TaxID=3157225 RepID=UPI00344E26B1
MAPDDVFAEGGGTGELMARIDWSRTPLGPVTGWPQSLRSAVRIVLSSRYPMLLLWGPEYTQLYNDAYSALIGDQHPAALGGDVRVTLEAGWDVLEPLIAEAMATGVASWVPALRLMLERAGYREEAYFSVSHAPARDDSGRTVGVLTVCSEVTEQVVGERRLRLLRDLPVRGGQSGGAGETCRRLAAAIAEHPLDVPFAGIYLRDGGVLRRAAGAGVDAAGRDVTALLPQVLDEAPPDTVRLDTPGSLEVAGGPWALPVRDTVAVPLPSADQAQPLGVLLAGISPSRALDDAYRSFFELLAQQVSVAVRNSLAYEEERRRAETLAELDRVKTAFFTDVSHEFRTPLTLMLGPLTDALADRAEPLGERQRDRVDTARRNATRLLTLVNNLMTFSSLEAGRAGNTPRQVDLARLTAELAGVFRAAVERASLRLVVDCPPLPRPTAVDPANWETIVTNLISNALKFTFVGTIRVALDSDDEMIRLHVTDSGIGIAAAELPHLFDRFHRVQGAQARSHEGSGVGLALVRELTRLLGGDVAVTSSPGSGTTVTVALPWTAVTPAGAVPGTAATGARARALAEEASGWLPEPGTAPDEPDEPNDPDELVILVADDNGDMRAYLTRLLTAENWQVEAVGDGQAALDSIRRRRPSLLLTDVMMPRLDGFALVRALRQDEATRTLPVVMLSARAGDEAGVEGLDAGADDYVVKPFTAAQLVARVRSVLERDRLRTGSARHGSAAAATTTVIASGRVLEDAVRAATEQACALVGGVRASTVLSGGPDRPPLTFSTTALPGKDGRGLVRTAIRARDGSEIGTLTVLLDAPAEPGDAEALLEPVAAMLAALGESRWELGDGRQIAITMQHNLLPESLPAVPGWDLAARYRPAPGTVCGDWYDAVAVDGGDLLLAVGDVAGEGPDAAVTAGRLRSAVRAYAAQDPTPERILARLVTMVSRLRTPSFATVLLARLSPGTGELTWATAGHPAPVTCRPGEPATWLTGASGPPLGLGTASYAGNRLNLPPGAHLLLFTDGLVADRGQPFDAGIARLLARCTDRSHRGVASADLLDAALAGDGGPPADDVAALALHRLPPERPAAAPAPPAALDRAWTYPLLPTASAGMRRDLRAALAGQVTPDLLDDLQLAATEAVNNAVEHAQQPARPQVDVRLQVADDVIRVSIQDYGTWRGRPAPMDRGRGALLMNAYGEVRVTSTPAGTLVTVERRLGPGPAPGP